MSGWGKLNGSLKGEMEVDHFIYLGSQIGMEGDVDVSSGVGEARRAASTVRKL